MTEESPARRDADTAYRVAIGRRLAGLRKAKNWSLREASERSGLSHSFIALVEKGESEIAVSRLLRLAEAYSAFLADVLSDVLATNAELVRKADAFRVPSTTEGIDLAFLSSGSWSVQPFRLTLPPGGMLADLSHHGDEFIYCVAGGVVAIVDDVPYELHAGDTLIVPEFSHHTFENRSKKESRLLGGVSRADGSHPVPHSAIRTE